MIKQTERATQWAHKAGLMDMKKVRPAKQYRVISGECSELGEAFQKLEGGFGTMEDMMKEIADVFVSLNTFTIQQGLTIAQCLDLKLPILEDRLEKGKIIEGVFVQSL